MNEIDNQYNPDFSSIKPFDEDHIHSALERILANPIFQQIINYLFPAETHDKLRNDLMEARTSLEFQKIFMYTGLKSVLQKTTPKGLNFDNGHYVSDGRAVSYIANHRDILLDSALLQVVLVDLGLETSEISFGDNLLVNDFAKDFSGINRMFTVFRGGSLREMLQNAKDLSAYVNHTLQEKKRSIWIAHRKGRTKNGLDKTDLGVLKMLVSSDKNNLKKALHDLEIVPLSISYEWEPCDAMKVCENYHNLIGTYNKNPGEDLQSLIDGIIGQKGGIHISFCQPVNQVIDTFDITQGNNPFLNQVVSYIDTQLVSNYKLWPSNYYAYDLAQNTQEFTAYYSDETINYFHQRMQKTIQLIVEDEETVKQLFIDLYANPVKAKQELRLHKTQ